jgi:hypothetical protein
MKWQRFLNFLKELKLRMTSIDTHYFGMKVSREWVAKRRGVND